MPFEEVDFTDHIKNCGELFSTVKIKRSSVILLHIGKKHWLHIRTLIINGYVPFIISKNASRPYDCIESHKGNCIKERHYLELFDYKL